MPVYTEKLADMIGGYLNATRIDRAGELALILGYARALKGPILELASGGGRVMNDLAEFGFEVYGIEYSAHMLKYAVEDRARRRPEVQERIHYIQGDMTRFSLRKKFPLIIVPYHSIWYNFEEGEAELCLRRIIEHLSPGGMFLIDNPSVDKREMFWRGDKLSWWRAMADMLGFTFYPRKYHTHFEPTYAGRYVEGEDSVMLEGYVVPPEGWRAHHADDDLYGPA